MAARSSVGQSSQDPVAKQDRSYRWLKSAFVGALASFLFFTGPILTIAYERNHVAFATIVNQLIVSPLVGVLLAFVAFILNRNSSQSKI